MTSFPYGSIIQNHFDWSPSIGDLQEGDIVSYNNGAHVAYAIGQYMVIDRNRYGAGASVYMGPSNVYLSGYSVSGRWRLRTDVVFPTQPPAAPYIYDTEVNNHPKIYWNKVQGITEYRVYKKNDNWPGNPNDEPDNHYYLKTTITSSSSTISYIDDGETIYTGFGTRYKRYYKVTAYSPTYGESDFSYVKGWTTQILW
jgi:hypothetical protein